MYVQHFYALLIYQKKLNIIEFWLEANIFEKFRLNFNMQILRISKISKIELL